MIKLIQNSVLRNVFNQMIDCESKLLFIIIWVYHNKFLRILISSWGRLLINKINQLIFQESIAHLALRNFDDKYLKWLGNHCRYLSLMLLLKNPFAVTPPQYVAYKR